MEKPFIIKNETDGDIYVTYDGSFKVTNATQSPLVARIHDAQTPWLYRSANLELVQIITSGVICLAALAALLWLMS